MIFAGKDGSKNLAQVRLDPPIPWDHIAGWSITLIQLKMERFTSYAQLHFFSQAGANFQNLVRTIASRVEGWTVEVWCWRSSCHSCYKRTRKVSFMWQSSQDEGKAVWFRRIWHCVVDMFAIWHYIYVAVKKRKGSRWKHVDFQAFFTRL